MIIRMNPVVLLAIERTFLHYERQYQCTVKSDDSGLRNAARNMSGYHRISHDFLLSLPRICIINQRLYIVYVRLATNLLQITEFTIKHPGKKQVYSGGSCPGTGAGYLSSNYVRFAVQLES
ncbi:hypothetical protein CHI19_25305 [Escherichia coli]|nr:hypothetical protein CHI19_25305 [Escherichia coli]